MSTENINLEEIPTFDNQAAPDINHPEELPSSSHQTQTDSQTPSTPISDAQYQSAKSGFADSTPWSGWAELENDPRIFTTLLREWGVPNVQVNEVVPLDAIFDKSPDAIYGLIFLSRWTSIDRNDDNPETPTNVWFANQISTFSCATVSLMNVINNRVDLDLGDRLNQFREQTKALSPKERGLALDEFDHVKDVHNSFATRIDKMYVDLRLKDDAIAAAKKKEARAQNSRKRRRKITLDDEDDESGFHFTAYVPAGGHVWCMDGMEATPRDLGALNVEDNWLATAVPDLQTQLESATANSLEFSLLSLTELNDTSSLASDIDVMQRTREDWGPFIAHMIKLHASRGDLKERLD